MSTPRDTSRSSPPPRRHPRYRKGFHGTRARLFPPTHITVPGPKIRAFKTAEGGGGTLSQGSQVGDESPDGSQTFPKNGRSRVRSFECQEHGTETNRWTVSTPTVTASCTGSGPGTRCRTTRPTSVPSRGLSHGGGSDCRPRTDATWGTTTQRPRPGFRGVPRDPSSGYGTWKRDVWDTW